MSDFRKSACSSDYGKPSLDLGCAQILYYLSVLYKFKHIHINTSAVYDSLIKYILRQPNWKLSTNILKITLSVQLNPCLALLIAFMYQHTITTISNALPEQWHLYGTAILQLRKYLLVFSYLPAHASAGININLALVHIKINYN